MQKYLLLVSAVVFVGCNSDGAAQLDADAPQNTCADGVAPPLSECSRGTFYADCGGTGQDSVLACREGDCLWFSAGCTAAGFTPSTCSSSDVCCHDGWPFEDAGQPQALYFRLLGLGLAPWAATNQLHVDVVLDAGLTATGSQFLCGGPDLELGLNNPCTGFPGFGQVSVGGTVVIQSPNGGVGGWYPWIEIVAAATTPSARVCAFSYTDAPRQTCPDSPTAVCAASGTVTLNRIPVASTESGLAAGFDVVFPGGFVLQGTIEVP